MKVEWKELEQFPDFLLSNEGVLYNSKTKKERSYQYNQQGIACVSLRDESGRQHTKGIAVMVADAFLPGKTDIFNTPTHLDGDRRNCRVDNLMWRPRWFAIKYHQQFTMPHFLRNTTKFYCVDTDEFVEGMMAAAMRYGVLGKDVMSNSLNGQFVFPCTYVFERVD
jgi:hypothetical protein